MEMDDDLAGDLALDDDKVHQASGGSMALTGNSTTDNSATDKPALKPRKTHHNKRRRAGTNTSARKEGSALRFDYGLPRPLDLDFRFQFPLSLGYLDGVGRAPPNRTCTRYPHSLRLGLSSLSLAQLICSHTHVHLYDPALSCFPIIAICCFFRL